MFAHLFNIKSGNITFTLVFRPFTQYFVEAPLAAITQVFLGMMLQAWHTCFGEYQINFYWSHTRV
jgi:hypothetical protein